MKLAKLPAATQHKYLSVQLRTFLQGISYQGRHKNILLTTPELNGRSYSKNLKNDYTVGFDTALFNQLGIPFTFKIFYELDDYERYDAGILNVERHHYSAVHPILQTIYYDNRSYSGEAIPFLTKHLAPGVSLAEVPNHQSNARTVLVEAAIKSWLMHCSSPGRKAVVRLRIAFITLWPTLLLPMLSFTIHISVRSMKRRILQ